MPDEDPVTDAAATDPAAFQCPSCGQTVEAAPEETARLLACPNCGEHLLIPAIDGSTELRDEAEAAREEVALGKEAELDGLRMRNVVALRRTAMRSRSYAIVGGCACVVGAVKLGLMTYDEVKVAGWGVWPTAFVGLIALAVWAARYCFRRAAHWAREGAATVLPEPETPPDFSTLSDGSQHAKNLEQIR
jgi:predicted RNA-binding Zn-ribbon protein involved in translation (DUF1610 family)